MKVFVGLSVLLITITALPAPQNEPWQGSTDDMDNMDQSLPKQVTHNSKHKHKNKILHYFSIF